jgi:hypothetical protein
MSRLFRSLAPGSRSPSSSSCAGFSGVRATLEEEDVASSEAIEPTFEADEAHLKAIYQYSNVLAFEFGHDRAKESIVRRHPQSLHNVGER